MSITSVIDTSAIQRYIAADGLAVAEALSLMADVGDRVLVPAICISEAYWAVKLDDTAMLDVSTHCRSYPWRRCSPLTR